jgi:hypothetical protein
MLLQHLSHLARLLGPPTWSTVLTPRGVPKLDRATPATQVQFENEKNIGNAIG